MTDGDTYGWFGTSCGHGKDIIPLPNAEGCKDNGLTPAGDKRQEIGRMLDLYDFLVLAAARVPGGNIMN
ncbi:MAG: hypothetical protein HY847_15005 [Betaproteobacteria bacterium]|nr:hypothetical protein [Betaproteobacteria bacterium]